MIEPHNVPTLTLESALLGSRNNGHSNTPLTPQTIETDLYLTAQEAAKIARIHPGTLLRWAREGRVPHRRLSARKVVFPLSKLHSWLGYTGSVGHAA